MRKLQRGLHPLCFLGLDNSPTPTSPQPFIIWITLTLNLDVTDSEKASGPWTEQIQKSKNTFLETSKRKTSK